MQTPLTVADLAEAHRSHEQSVSSPPAEDDGAAPGSDPARYLAGRHAGTLAASTLALSKAWHGHLDVLVAAQHTVLDPVRLDRLSWLAERYLAGRAPLFELRLASARTGAAGVDPIADVVRIALDLEIDGKQELVDPFVEAYRESSGDIFPASLIHHYTALEATARAGDAIRDQAAVPGAASLARRLVLLAVRHLDMGRTHLILVGGEPGSGKSTLATRLVDACGWTLLNSTQVRSEALDGGSARGLSTAWMSGGHDRADTLRTYDEMLRRARLLLARGQSVIADATWAEAPYREQASQMATAVFADFVSLRCDSGEAVRDARIRNRIAAGPRVADAAVDISRRIAARFQPWPEAAIVDTSQPVWRSVATALRIIAVQGASMTMPSLESAG